MTRVQIVGVTKEFPTRGRNRSPLKAVDNVSIDIASGEIHAVIGYSGAGKSTLLRLINGLEKATEGKILVGGTDTVPLTEKGLRGVRSGIGMVFQQFNLLLSRNALGNVEFPLKLQGLDRAKRRARALELLAFVGLQGKEKFFPEQLSGGQRQRVGIARALATNPGVLLADEATSALDPETSAEVLALLKRVNDELGITVILITHEMEVVRQIAHRVTVMESGRVVESGDTYKVFSSPESAITKKFVSTALPNQLSPEILEAVKKRARGTVVTVSFTDEGEAAEPVIFSTLTKHGVVASIEGGGVTSVAGRIYGEVTLEIIGEADRVKEAIEELREFAKVEVL